MSDSLKLCKKRAKGYFTRPVGLVNTIETFVVNHHAVVQFTLVKLLGLVEVSIGFGISVQATEDCRVL